MGFYTFKKKKEDCSLQWNTMIALKALIFKLCSMKPQRARGLCVWPLCVVFGVWYVCMWFGVLYTCIYVQYVCRVCEMYVWMCGVWFTVHAVYVCGICVCVCVCVVVHGCGVGACVCRYEQAWWITPSSLLLLQSKQLVTKWERSRGRSRGRMDWEFGIRRCKLLYLGWINSKVLLYSTGNSIQSPGTNHNGKEFLKCNICVYL